MTRRTTDSPSILSETQQSRRGRSTIVSGAWGTGSIVWGTGSIVGEGSSRTGTARRGDSAGSGAIATAGPGGVSVRVGRPGYPDDEEERRPRATDQHPPKHQPGHEPLTCRAVIPVRPVVGHRVRGALVRWQLRHEVAYRLLGVEPDRGRVRPDEPA